MAFFSLAKLTGRMLEIKQKNVMNTVVHVSAKGGWGGFEASPLERGLIGSFVVTGPVSALGFLERVDMSRHFNQPERRRPFDYYIGKIVKNL